MHVGCSTKASATFPVPCGLGDGYHREDEAFPWHSHVPPPERFHVNAVCSPRQPPAGAVAPGTAGRSLAAVGQVPRGRRWPWCPGRGTCVNGMGTAREEMSLHTLCSASCLSLWAEWALQAPQFHEVLSQKVWGAAQGRYNSCFYSFLIFHPQRSTPCLRRGETLACALPRSCTSLQSLVCIHEGFWDLGERSEDLAKSFQAKVMVYF